MAEGRTGNKLNSSALKLLMTPETLFRADMLREIVFSIDKVSTEGNWTTSESQASIYRTRKYTASILCLPRLCVLKKWRQGWYLFDTTPNSHNLQSKPPYMVICSIAEPAVRVIYVG